MRNIKFRTFYKDENILYRDVDISSECLPIDDENVVIMQYTGLRDKNGVEIYEGDIIELASNKTSVGIVVFNEDDFGVPCFCIKEDEESYQPFFAKGDEPRIWFEVIGNIHENPELLHAKE